MISNEDLLSGRRGTFSVNDTTAVVKDFAGVLILEDTVIASLLRGTVDVKATYIQTPANVLKAGSFIRPLEGEGNETFNGITLTSGSAILIL